jgi:exopolysaccharide biosynthesis WecB/TagA/CpsF family protein
MKFFFERKNDYLYFANRRIYTGNITDLLTYIYSCDPKKESPRYIYTMNVDQIISVMQSTQHLALYNESFVRTIDGAPLVWLSKYLGVKTSGRVTGADLLPAVAASAQEHKWKIAIVGGKAEVSKKAVRIINGQNNEIIAYYIPIPKLTDIRDSASTVATRKLNELNPNIVFLCLGGRKQESWYYQWRKELPSAIYIGSGAAVDFVAGNKRRAPRWVQMIGAEWVYRLFQEPGRLWKRYLLDAVGFSAIIFSTAFRRYLRRL